MLIQRGGDIDVDLHARRRRERSVEAIFEKRGFAISRSAG
jgi:hypothetical protein